MFKVFDPALSAAKTLPILHPGKSAMPISLWEIRLQGAAILTFFQGKCDGVQPQPPSRMGDAAYADVVIASLGLD